jgi:pimeloyl-ACP methyl ester carboxylesterase
MRRIVPLATAACVALGALTATGATGATAASGTASTSAGRAAQAAGSASSATPGRPAATSISWGPCADASLRQVNAECGFLSVPLDPSKPKGSTIKIALSRVKHTSPASAYQGVMLVNPGGPGASGLNLALLGASVPKHAGDTYDWIGFDPRGVGASKPAMSCVPTYFGGNRPAYVPVTSALEKTWLTRSASYARACAKDAPKLLPHMKTVDSARDMDAIRAALRAPKLSYYGFSYGTYLGQVYATLFPTRVRRMVLDSNVDPRDVWYQANLHQDTAFELTMGAWFSWLAKYNSTYQLGTTEDEVRQLFYTEETALQKAPAKGLIGPDEWDDAFLFAGYAQSTWPGLGTAFANWVHHRDATQLVAAYQDADTPGNDNGFAVYSAVQCTDVSWPSTWSTWKQDAWRLNRVAPFLTWANTWYNTPCLSWAAKPGTPVDVRGGSTSALLVDETLDAATPYEGSLEVRRRFPHSSLIAEPGGTTHAGSLLGNACVDDKIAAYLATGVLPVRRAGFQADAECAPLPQPAPDTGGTASPTPSVTPRAVQPAGRRF